MEDTIQLPREAAKALLGYLETRPYGEVCNACGWLQAALAPQTPQTPQSETESD